jgi:hypothetical protein
MATTYPDRLSEIKARLAATERNRCIDCDGLVERGHADEERCGPCQAEHDARQTSPASFPLLTNDLSWAIQEIDFLRLYLGVLSEFAFALDGLRWALENPAPGRVERRRRAFEEARQELLAIPNWRPGECHGGCRRYATHEFVIEQDGHIKREPCCEECGALWRAARRAATGAGWQPAAELRLEPIPRPRNETREVPQ